MKLAVLFASVCFGVLSAQAQSLVIHGVTLSLGEAESKARSDIVSAGIEIKQSPDIAPSLMVKHGNQYEFLGDIDFKNGKVVWLQRDWYLDDTPNDKTVLAGIFHSAVSSLLEGAAQETCTIQVRNLDNTPSSGVSKITDITCAHGTYEHGVHLLSVDCAGGCSIGTIAPGLSESLKSIN